MRQTTRWFSRVLVVAAFIYALWYIYSNWIGFTPMRFSNAAIPASGGQTITMAHAMENYAKAAPGAMGYPGTMTIHPKSSNASLHVVDWLVKGKEYVFDWGSGIPRAANANANLMMKAARR